MHSGAAKTQTSLQTCTVSPELYILIYMGESFQDQSWIQDFEADFLWKVSLKNAELGRL